MQAILMTLRCKKCTYLHTQLLIIMKDWFQSDRAIIKFHAQAIKFRPWHIRLSLFCYMLVITIAELYSVYLSHVYSVPQQKAARYNIGPKFHHALVKNTDYFRKILCIANISKATYLQQVCMTCMFSSSHNAGNIHAQYCPGLA